MIFIGTHAECDELHAIADKLDPPRPPDRIVGETRKRLSQVQADFAAWLVARQSDPDVPAPFGVTRVPPPVEHPTNRGTWAIELPEPDATREAQRLTGAERTALTALRATAVTELPDDWKLEAETTWR